MFDVQLHIGKTMPSKRDFRRVENGVGLIVKPAMGGMWSSTFNPQYGSHWVQYASQAFGNTHKLDSFLIYPDPSIRVATIGSFADLNSIYKEYKVHHPFFTSDFYAILDFERMARDFDAIHLTAMGQTLTRHSRPSLYGWDVECVLWLNPAFDRVVYLGRRKYNDKHLVQSDMEF